MHHPSAPGGMPQMMTAMGQSNSKYSSFKIYSFTPILVPPFPHGQMPITSGGQFHPANFQQMIAQQQMAAAQQGQFIPAAGTLLDF